MIQKLLVLAVGLLVFMVIVQVRFHYYWLFYRLLYGGFIALAAVSIAGLLLPQKFFGNRVFAAIGLFWTLQMAMLTIAMQHY